MDVRQLIDKVNSCAEDLDFVAARVYIEENFDVLEANIRFLKRNARELFDFIKSQRNGNVQALSRKDMAVINAINSYASNFDVRGIKFLIKDNVTLFIRPEVMTYLNTDARTIMGGMKL